MVRKKRKNVNRKSIREKAPNYLGQHLMHNKKLLNEIVNEAKVSSTDLVLELGAGKGALTEILSAKVKKVIAVEYDKKFIGHLKEKLGDRNNTKILQQDILKISLPKEPFVVVSNIPYAITTPIMKMLLNNPTSHFQRGVIIMEKGAAKRFTAKYVKAPYVIAWRMWFQLAFVKGISRKNFSPPPRVDSAMVKIERKKYPIVPYNYYSSFWGVAQYVLKHPQLPIDIALRGIFTVPQIHHIKRNLRIKSETPVGALSEQQWGLLHDTMVNYVPKYRWPKMNKRKM